MDDKYVEIEIPRPDGVSEEALGDYGFVNGSRFEYRYDKPIKMPKLMADLIKERQKLQRESNKKVRIKDA